jgi:putative DNA primase/helicase
MTIAELLSKKSAAQPAPTPPAEAVEITADPITQRDLAPLAFFDNAFGHDPSDETTLPELIEMVRAGRWQVEVAALRKSLADHGRGDYDKAKRKLPAVMLSGTCRTRRADADEDARAIRHSGLLQGDFDGKDHPHLALAEIMDLVRADPHVVAAFVSPSGQGVKAVLAVACNEHQHRAAWEASAEHFEQFGLKLDPSTKDPGRLCFVSSDPDAWIRDEWAVTAFKPKRAAAKGATGFDPLDTTAADVREMLSFIPPRPDYEDWLRIASAVWSVLDELPGCDLLNEWSPEEKPGEYQRKFKKRLRDIRIGTLAWYAQANGFDAAEAARRKRWCGRISFAETSRSGRLIEIAPDHVDGVAKSTDIEGPEDADNPQFVDWCLRHEQRGDAELWQAIAQGSRLYDHFAGCWRIYRGSAWERDHMDAVKVELVDSLSGAYRDLIRDLSQQIAAKPSDDPKSDPRRATRKAAEERVKSLHRAQWLRGTMEFAKSMPKLATRASEFDRNPYLLAVENGVLDFEACEFREAHPLDMLTHRAGVRFDPAAECPKFRAFMNRMLPDPEVSAFVMRSMAYSMTGLTDADVLFFSYGKGANGKSTFMLVFKLLLGELMTTIDVNTLLATKADANQDYKKSTLEGRRAAMTDEVPEGRKLGESMVKALIGGDEIVARRPYEKPYTFSPTHKLWMVGNHKPTIEGTDAGIWRRICLIPWTQTIPAAERRPRAEVIAEFRQELPGILNWVLVAWQEFQQLGGLMPPKAVQEATDEYQHEQDQLGSFLEERTEKSLTESVAAQKLLKTYLAWCEDNGERAIYKTSRQIIGRMRDKGFVIRKGHNNTNHIDGIEILGPERD